MQVDIQSLTGYEYLMDEFQFQLKRMSQTELARAAGVTVQHICDVVGNRRPPNAQLISYLGFQIDLDRKP